MSMSFPPRRYRLGSPPTFLTYETIHHNQYSRSPSPESDSEEDSGDESDHSSQDNDNEGAHIMGEMELDLPPGALKLEDNNEMPGESTSTRNLHTEDDDDDDEELKEEQRRKRAEKRKGKQPEQTAAHKAEMRAKRRARRAQEAEESYHSAYRPILTIKSSQGFVWNQELFVPARQKDRYLCSTSPASDMSPPAMPSSFTSGMDFEVECVEIRIREGELDGLIPR